MGLPRVSTGKMIDILKDKDTALAVEGLLKGSEVCYKHENDTLSLWVKEPNQEQFKPFQIMNYHKDTLWVIKPKYNFIEFSEAINLYLSNSEPWIAVIREGEELYRFKNKSMYFVAIIKDGCIDDVKKSDFSIPIADIEKSTWAVVVEEDEENDDQLIDE